MKNIFIFLLFFTTSTFAQNNITSTKSEVNSYFPLETKDTLYYANRQGRSLSWFEKHPSLFDDHYYVVQKIESENARSKIKTHYYREENGFVYEYDTSTGTESILLVEHPKKGMKWTNADKSWSYKVIGLKSKYQTSSQLYTDLLEIKAKHLEGLEETFHFFYKKGLGLVAKNKFGIKKKKKQYPFLYLVPKERKITRRFCSTLVCDEIVDNKSLKYCVGREMGRYLKGLFSLKKNTVRGKYIVKILVDVDGKIIGTTVSEMPKGGEKTAQQLEKIIESFDRLLPATVDDMIPGLYSLTLPVNI